METVRIRDPGWKKVGSGIRDKHPGSATLPLSMWIKWNDSRQKLAELIFQSRVSLTVFVPRRKFIRGGGGEGQPPAEASLRSASALQAGEEGTLHLRGCFQAKCNFVPSVGTTAQERCRCKRLYTSSNKNVRRTYLLKRCVKNGDRKTAWVY